MSSPHFNSVTAIGCLMIYTHELLASFNNSRIYSGDSRSLCLVSSFLAIISSLVLVSNYSNKADDS